MSIQSSTVDIPDELKKSLRKFRFARRNAGSAALIVKIDKKNLVMVEDEQFDDISLEDLAEGMHCSIATMCDGCVIAMWPISELPENAPRYVLLSYEVSFDDGRKSFPLVLVNWAPTTSETSLLTLHASALIDFQNTVCHPSPCILHPVNLIS